MKTEYNSQAFTPEEIKQGLYKQLLDFLLNYNSKAEKDFNDIHISTDGYCMIIEWINRPYNHEYGGEFRYIDEDKLDSYFDIDDPNMITISKEEYNELRSVKIAPIIDDIDKAALEVFKNYIARVDSKTFYFDVNSSDMDPQSADTINTWLKYHKVKYMQ